MIVIGIDENGLAPLLGPLVTTATAFNFPTSKGEYCLWEKYSNIISKKRKKYPKKLIVNDSKKLFNSQNIKESFQIIANTTEAFSKNNTAISEYLGRSSISLPPLKFNKKIKQYGSKNLLNLACFLTLINKMIKKYPEKNYRIYCGKIGATKKYLPKIQKLSFSETTFWNQSKIRIIDERNAKSHYSINNTQTNTKLELIFSINSDQKHFPVALASTVGKHIREVYMQQFNNYFQKLDPNLPTPTGYPNKYTYQFIKQSKKLRRDLKIPTEAIIRIK